MLNTRILLGGKVRRITTYLLPLLFTLLALPAMAQRYVSIADTVSYEVHFRWDRSKLDTMYMGNNRVFDAMAQQIDSLGESRIDSIVIVSQSSPEGPYYYNQNLSHRRAAAMRRYMEGRHPDIRERLTIEPDGESWLQLRAYVLKDTHLEQADKERIVNLIDDDSMAISLKKRRISRDKDYRYLYATYYPRIRNSRIQIVYHTLYECPPPVLHSKLEFPPLHVPRMNIEKPVVPVKKTFVRDTLVIAAKTNLLYDVVTALNFELELPIGDHWSVAVEDVFPWWEKDNKYCFQMWEMGIEGRYWFRQNTHYVDKLRGHFLGAYVMSSKFDFQNDYDICYQGEYWSTGLTYGYSMKLTHHLNMEFSISVGWLSSAYRHYYPADDYSLLWRDRGDSGRVGYFGPTKLKVALVWPIRIQYKNRRAVR